LKPAEFPHLTSSLPISARSWQLMAAPPLYPCPSFSGSKWQLVAAPSNPIISSIIWQPRAAIDIPSPSLVSANFWQLFASRGFGIPPASDCLCALSSSLFRLHERKLRHAFHQTVHNLRHKAHQRSPLLIDRVKMPLPPQLFVLMGSPVLYSLPL